MVFVMRGAMVSACLMLLLCSMGCKENPNKTQNPPAPPLVAPGPNPGVLASLSSVNRRVFADDLRNIGLAYVATEPPAQSAQALGNVIQKQLPSINNGTYVILWGADHTKPGASTKILGYVKDVPEKGGVVLMLDGTIRDNMSAQEFARTEKGK
jgi:hypothetical protein